MQATGMTTVQVRDKQRQNEGRLSGEHVFNSYLGGSWPAEHAKQG